MSTAPPNQSVPLQPLPPVLLRSNRRTVATRCETNAAGYRSHQAAGQRQRIGQAIDYADIPRDDIAPVLAELVRQPGIRRRILELTAGPTPISDAVACAVAAPGRRFRGGRCPSCPP